MKEYGWLASTRKGLKGYGRRNPPASATGLDKLYQMFQRKKRNLNIPFCLDYSRVEVAAAARKRPMKL